MSVGYNEANVRIAGTHAGIGIGDDGASQMALEDVAAMRALPNMAVIQPADAAETVAAVKYLADEHVGPAFLRLTRQKLDDVNGEGYTLRVRQGREAPRGLRRVPVRERGDRAGGAAGGRRAGRRRHRGLRRERPHAGAARRRGHRARGRALRRQGGHRRGPQRGRRAGLGGVRVAGAGRCGRAGHRAGVPRLRPVGDGRGAVRRVRHLGEARGRGRAGARSAGEARTPRPAPRRGGRASYWPRVRRRPIGPGPTSRCRRSILSPQHEAAQCCPVGGVPGPGRHGAAGRVGARAARPALSAAVPVRARGRLGPGRRQRHGRRRVGRPALPGGS